MNANANLFHDFPKIGRNSNRSSFAMFGEPFLFNFSSEARSGTPIHFHGLLLIPNSCTLHFRLTGAKERKKGVEKRVSVG